MLSAKEQGLLEVLEPQAAAHGVEIVTVEIVGAKKAPTIRVYIDTPEGVGFDELAASQTWINDILDEVDPFPGAYTLEVSSPGIDRPLRTPEHFARFAGQEAQVTLAKPVEGRSKFTGRIEGVEGAAVRLFVDGEEVTFEIPDMKRARLKGEIDFSSKR